MDIEFTEEQEILRASVGKLLAEVCPQEYVQKCDTEAVPPREAYNSLAAKGWLGLILPEEYGGSDGSTVDLAILLEEAGKYYEELAVWMFRSMVWALMHCCVTVQKNKNLNSYLELGAVR